MRSSHFANIAFVLLAGCAESAPTPADSAAALDAIYATENAQVGAFASRDIDSALAPYVANAAFAQFGAPHLEGVGAIRPAMAAMLADPALHLEFTPKGSFVSASGDLAVTVADYAFTYTDPVTNQSVTEHGVNQTVWQKQADGSWKNASDFNVATAPPALE